MAAPLSAEEFRYLEEARNPQLMRLNRQVLDAVFFQVLQLELDQRAGAGVLDRELARRMELREDGEETARSKRRAAQAVGAVLRRNASSFRQRLRATTTATTRAQAFALQAWLAARGRDLDDGVVMRLVRSVAQDESPFLGKTTSERVRRIEERHRIRIEALLANDEDPDTTRRRIYMAGSEGIGGRPTPRGSVVREFQRLFLSETLRRAYEVSVLVFAAAEVQFAHRRISGVPAPRTKMGLCEKLNTQIFPGIESALREYGLSPENIDLRGLYPMMDMPVYPHPLCKCWPDPSQTLK